MDSMKLSYSEVSTYHLHASAKGEISLDIGANQSTLQDFKLAESVGYYCYKDSNIWSSPTCNRFIYWRSNKDYIQFYEVSLDFNLARNHVQLRFHNTPILDGVSVHETEDQVIILLATVASIHRITLTHPRKLGTVLIDTVRSGSNILPHGSNNINPSDLHTRKSIFYDLNAANLRNPDSYHVLNNSFNLGGSLSSSDMPFPIRSCSWLNSDKEAYFALADYTGNISVIRMNPSSSGKVTVYNLKQTGLIKSLWYNLVPSRMSMSRGNPDNEQAALSILWHHLPSIEDDLMITLCRDLKIRIWSCSKQDYVAAESIESFQDMSSGYSTTSINKSVNDPMIVTRPVLKKDASSNGSDELFLAAFVPTTSGRKFIVYKLLFVGENLTLKVVTSIDALQEDLVDFVFTPNTLWALWRLAESEVTLSHWEINDDSSCWQSVTTYNHFQPPINVKSMLISPKELFIEKIFKKGKFSSQTIAKAISTLNRTHESYYSFLNTESLIEEVANAVENRLRSLPGVGECSPDVYSNLECELWNEFYSYCLQYHNVFNKPLGLFMDSRTGLTGILRVSSVSYLRANDPIDHVLLSRVHTPNYDITNILTDDFSLETSLQQLLQFIKTINSYLDEDAFLQLEMSCTADEPVEKVFREVVNKYLITDPCDLDIGKSNMLSSVEDALESSRILEAVDLILRTLNIESKDHSDEAMDSSVTMVQQSLDQFLSGNIGVCILTESIKQTCRLRFEFCRDLLLFQLLVRLSTTNSTDYDRLCDTLENSIALNKLCLKSYYSMAWISETSMSLKDSTFLGIENTVTLLATLELHEFINVNRNPPTANALVHDFSPKSIVAHLIGHKKCPSARKILSSHAEDVEEPENCQTWLTFQPSLVQAIGTIIWPTSNSSFVLRFLLGFEQFELIDQYSKMLDAWCDHSIASRRFCMGITQLFFGDPKKSVGYFHQALNGLLEEPFLQKIFLASLSNSSIERKPNDSLTNAEITTYFNKLFRLCRLHSQNEIILDLALGAIDLLDESGSSYDQHFSSFMTTIFMCHLEFGNTVDAFCSMLLNPSAIQRKDCLRQFTVKLYEKQAISEMINYDYGEMEDDFINILEFRARSTDLLQTEKKVDFYEILYSYFVKRNNYRKSASIIYEYAKRLCQEVNGVESLKKQARCFLLAINSLKLIDPKYAWIIQPTIKASSSSLHFGRSSSSVTSSIKRKHGLDDAQESPPSDTITRKEIQVLNINDIVKEYELTNARYKLLEKSSQLNSIASTPLSAEETITLLISNLQFDLAFQLSTHFDLPYEPVLEGLVGKYVYLTELPFRKMSLEAGLMEINECFIENDTASASFIANAEMPAIDKMLFLILTYIEKYEEKNQTRLHKCVAEKLLESGIPLPNPLKLSYQKRNSPELLRILMSYDYIESAFNFAMELIDGYLGQGTEYFDIKAPKIGSKQETYFPHQHIKCLLEILEKEKDDHKDYEEFAKQLIHKRDKYRELILSCHQITAR